MVSLPITGVRDLGIVSSAAALAALSPSVGDLCTYNAGGGVFWRLQYDGAGSYPWKVIGGSPLAARDDTLRTRSATGYGDLTSPLSLTLPLAGDWDVTIQADTSQNTSLQAAYLSYAVGAVAASDAWAIVNSLTASVFVSLAKTTRQTGVTAASVVAEKARTSSTNTGTYAGRRLRAMPVRVSG
jgi:hypothetical protein